MLNGCWVGNRPGHASTPDSGENEPNAVRCGRLVTKSQTGQGFNLAQELLRRA